ncbi:SERTA domain-containing protein 2 [Suncus etruscus]|uniref:SERTA domain-containing protein 2 n=1 Tax=Suncus etruscus TaxID=109475 RepID=UPI0021107D03|nr:SERTA domain-containing protein 2 [Suncus etruscus]XP_049640705.1 SERTA domain-containing protein 2 [Suncus etruscus]
MLGKGEKRKFDEYEDGLEGKVVSPSDGPSKVSYTLQRQTIFNISLMKLYNHRPLTEPSLQKTVLINNMLRRIQEELKQEGGLRPVFAPASASASASASPPQAEDGAAATAAAALSDSCREAPPTHPCDLGSTPPLEACLTPASLLEADDDAFCTAPAALPLPTPPPLSAAPTKLSPPALPPEKDSFSSALDEIEELCPTSTSPEAAATVATSASGSALAPHCALIEPGGGNGGTAGCGLQRLEGDLPGGRADDPKLMADSLPGNFEITTSTTGFLTDLTLDDILFADIDTSMYDFDPCAASASGAAAAASKMAPVSADDLLKTLAPYSSQPVAPSQPFKMDLTELDHIMEVLVGS